MFEKCPICCENKILFNKYECIHKFCKECVIKWNTQNKTCPLCRSKIKQNNHYIINIFPENNIINQINTLPQNNNLNNSISNNETPRRFQWENLHQERNILTDLLSPLWGIVYASLLVSIFVILFEKFVVS